MKPIAGSVAFLLVIAGFSGLFVHGLGAAELININTATLAELDTLPGIGPSKAQAIIDYRSSSAGPFETIEEVKQVNGIGDAIYEDIKNLITVGTTPEAQTTGTEESQQQETQEKDGTDESAGSSANRPKPPTSISARIYAEESAVAGAEVLFEAEAKEGSKKLSAAKFEWSFGDGASVRGGRAVHTYHYPGTYAVVVTASQGGVEATAQHTIEVLELSVALVAEADGSLSLVNETKQDINLGYWSIAAGEKTFTFPAGTLLLAGETVRLSPAVSGIGNGAGAVLFFSNGTVATHAQPRAAFDAAQSPVASGWSAGYIVPAAAPDAATFVESQVAAAAGVPFELPVAWGYGLGLLALLLIGAVAVFYLQGSNVVSATQSPADGFEIIDAKR